MEAVVTTEVPAVTEAAPVKKARKPRKPKVAKVEAPAVETPKPIAMAPVQPVKAPPLDDNFRPHVGVTLLPSQLKRHYDRIGADPRNHEETLLYSDNGVNCIDIYFFDGFMDVWEWVKNTQSRDPRFTHHWNLASEHIRQDGSFRKAA